ncbi:MAG: hypothetical protein IKW21_06130 [Lachnospiraceae bacterium]|nr:hypothetical protein [Lachnospiraceae bacterium]
MINKIIDGISVALNEEFGDGYEIHTERIEQGLVEPCFSILCIKPSESQVLGKRYFKQNQFCIYYYPESDEKNKENLSVIERLFSCLEMINVDGDMVRGTNMDSEITDDVVAFMVNYDMHVYKQPMLEPFMETFDVDTGLKG